MIKSFKNLVLMFSLGGIFIFTPHLKAQSNWLDYNQTKIVALEILKAVYDEADETFLTSTLFFTTRYALNQSFVIVGELPFSHWGWDSEWSSGSESALGNPYFGIEYRLRESPLFFEVGARAPVAPDDNDAVITGVVTEYIDRMEAFILDIVPITIFANCATESQSGFAMRFRGGPIFWLATGDRDDSETMLFYSAQAFYNSEKIRIGGGFSGRYWTTADVGNFDENSFHQIGFSVNVMLGNVSPGVYLKIPLDEDFKEIIDLVFGIKIDYKFE